MSNSCSFFKPKPWITAAIANFIKGKNNVYKKLSKKNLQQQKTYEQQFKTYRNYLILLTIAKNEYCKTHFKKKLKKLKTAWKTIKETII